jgi:hypothetical protein
MASPPTISDTDAGEILQEIARLLNRLDRTDSQEDRTELIRLCRELGVRLPTEDLDTGRYLLHLIEKYEHAPT